MSILLQTESAQGVGDHSPAFRLSRFAGFCFGIGTQLLFLWTVIYLFLFLRYCSGSSYAGWWWSDFLMAAGFAIPHSILLLPAVQKRIRNWLPPGLLGCLHCSVTCISLLLMFGWWGSSGIVLWEARGWLKSLVLACFYGSWVALLY
ncbi:MAG: hypothetical protein ACK53V_14865, partial [Planctomycetota bacterium]